MIRHFLAFFFLLLACCTPAHAPELHNGPAVIWHGDVEFTPSERVMIEQAAQVWEKYSNGWVTLRVVWDLDFRDEQTLEAPFIVRSDSRSGIFQYLDSTTGLTHLGVAPGQSIVLAVDRLQNPSDFYEVTMHEMGHTVGMNHVQDQNSIMTAKHRPHMPWCPSRADMSEFCYATGCKMHTVRWCP